MHGKFDLLSSKCNALVSVETSNWRKNLHQLNCRLLRTKLNWHGPGMHALIMLTFVRSELMATSILLQAGPRGQASTRQHFGYQMGLAISACTGKRHLLFSFLCSFLFYQSDKRKNDKRINVGNFQQNYAGSCKSICSALLSLRLRCWRLLGLGWCLLEQ
eukprot:SAG31_NODE_1858_length_7061_cov_60.221201_4_plen_160_part_00